MNKYETEKDKVVERQSGEDRRFDQIFQGTDQEQLTKAACFNRGMHKIVLGLTHGYADAVLNDAGQASSYWRQVVQADEEQNKFLNDPRLKALRARVDEKSASEATENLVKDIRNFLERSRG